MNDIKKTPQKNAIKNGAKKEVKKFYKTKAWQRKREVILKRDRYECRQCKRYGKTRVADTVHHVVPMELDSTRALDSTNLLSLCRTCHNLMHDRYTDELTPLGYEWTKRKV